MKVLLHPLLLEQIPQKLLSRRIFQISENTCWTEVTHATWFIEKLLTGIKFTGRDSAREEILPFVYYTISTVSVYYKESFTQKMASYTKSTTTSPDIQRPTDFL